VSDASDEWWILSLVRLVSLRQTQDDHAESFRPNRLATLESLKALSTHDRQLHTSPWKFEMLVYLRLTQVLDQVERHDDVSLYIRHHLMYMNTTAFWRMRYNVIALLGTSTPWEWIGL
jgi:hypothetical protein